MGIYKHDGECDHIGFGAPSTPVLRASIQQSVGTTNMAALDYSTINSSVSAVMCSDMVRDHPGCPWRLDERCCWALTTRGLAIPQYCSIFVCGLGRILQYQYLSIAVFWYQYFSILEYKSVAVLQYCSIAVSCTFLLYIFWAHRAGQVLEAHRFSHQVQC